MSNTLSKAVSNFDLESPEESSDVAIDSRVLSSVIISTKLTAEDPAHGKNPQERLFELMHSPPIQALLEAAKILSHKESLSTEESLRQIVSCFRNVDHLWNQVLLQEGIAHLSSQYH